MIITESKISKHDEQMIEFILINSGFLQWKHMSPSHKQYFLYMINKHIHIPNAPPYK